MFNSGRNPIISAGVFSLKGFNILAQGNALRIKIKQFPCLTKTNNILCPFRATFIAKPIFPQVLPGIESCLVICASERTLLNSPANCSNVGTPNMLVANTKTHKYKWPVIFDSLSMKFSSQASLSIRSLSKNSLIVFMNLSISSFVFSSFNVLDILVFIRHLCVFEFYFVKLTRWHVFKFSHYIPPSK